jgi:hypothetical protein
VAERTTDRGQIELSSAVKAELKAYQTALQRDLNRRASYGDIIGALLWGVPLWQANAMIDAYRPQHESRDNPGSEDEERG